MVGSLGGLDERRRIGMSFAAASAVERVGDTTWRGEVLPDWDIVGNANGGYLLALLPRG